jgi:hypothetical protein
MSSLLVTITFILITAIALAYLASPNSLSRTIIIAMLAAFTTIFTAISTAFTAHTPLFICIAVGIAILAIFSLSMWGYIAYHRSHAKPVDVDIEKAIVKPDVTVAWPLRCFMKHQREPKVEVVSHLAVSFSSPRASADLSSLRNTFRISTMIHLPVRAHLHSSCRPPLVLRQFTPIRSSLRRPDVSPAAVETARSGTHATSLDDIKVSHRGVSPMGVYMSATRFFRSIPLGFIFNSVSVSCRLCLASVCRFVCHLSTLMSSLDRCCTTTILSLNRQ